MKPINEMTTRELEIEQVRRAIEKTNAKIAAFEKLIERMTDKQIARQYEISRQLTLANVVERKMDELLKALKDEKP